MELLGPALDVNRRQASNAMKNCGSKIITPDLRIAAALIMLAGGKSMEVMRTYGYSRSIAYANLHRFVRIVNQCPTLEIKTESTISEHRCR